MVGLEGIIIFGIPCLLVGTGIFFIIKSGKNQNKKKAFFFISLGINLIVSPLSLFIGGMATDSGDQSLFWNGFFFIQGIPLLVFLASVILLLINRKKDFS